jgi:Ca2+-binding RTX toxin-like protein
MNYSVLSNEINNDPLGVGYASMDAYQIRDSINGKTRSSYKVLTSNDLLKWSGKNGRYIKVKNAADNTSLSNEIRSAAFAAVVMVERDNTLFDYNDTNSQNIFNILVSNDIISQEDKNDLVSTLTENVSRAQELGLPQLRKKHVERAKNGS